MSSKKHDMKLAISYKQKNNNSSSVLLCEHYNNCFLIALNISKLSTRCESIIYFFQNSYFKNASIIVGLS